MESENLKMRIRHMYATGQAILGGGVGAEQSPFLSALFNPNNDLAAFFNTAFKSAIVIGAMLAVLRLGYAGFIYMTTDVWSSKQSATSIIQEAVLGLLLLLGVWLILNQINPNLLNLDVLKSVTPVSIDAPPSSPTSLTPLGQEERDVFTRSEDTPEQCQGAQSERPTLRADADRYNQAQCTQRHLRAGNNDQVAYRECKQRGDEIQARLRINQEVLRRCGLLQ